MAASIQVMMACGAFSPRRALATSARFFAMTTGATGATVNALSRRGPRAWPTLEAANSTVAFNTAARSSGTTRRRSQLGCMFGRQRNARRDEVHATNNAKSSSTMYRLVSPKSPNLWQPGPNQAHRMVSQSVPSGTVLHPFARHIPSHRPWYRRSVPTVQQHHQCVVANRPPSTSTQTNGIAVASRPSATQPFAKPAQVRCPHARPVSSIWTGRSYALVTMPGSSKTLKSLSAKVARRTHKHKVAWTLHWYRCTTP